MNTDNSDRSPVATWTTPVHRAPLIGLDVKVRPSHTALLVIDVLNDFCADAGMMALEGLDVSAVQDMAQRLPSLLDAGRTAGVLIAFVRNEYSTPKNWYLSDVWLEMASRRRDGRSYTVRPACPPGSWQNDFFGNVRPQPGEPIVTKHRYSAFYATDLEVILRTHAIRTLVLTGVASNVCVETTAREAFIRDYYVVFPSDGTAAYSEPEHEATLRTIDTYFGEVVTMKQLTDIWDGHCTARSARNRRATRRSI